MDSDNFNIQKTTSHSNRTQLSIMFDFMENNEDLAKGYADTENGKAKLQKLWKILTEKLNANGPPTRTTTEWKRVWTIHKYKTKKKLINNKKSISKTGGGPCQIEHMTPEEEGIITACGFETTINGIGGVKTFGSSHYIEETSNDMFTMELPSTSSICENSSTVLNKNATPRNTHSSVEASATVTANAKHSLLEKQIQIQEEHLDIVKKSYTEQVRFNNEILKIAQQLVKNGEEERRLKQQELQLIRLELEVKQAENEIQRAKLNCDRNY